MEKEEVDKADLFKEAFKRYKKKEADLSDVIDFTKPSQYDREVDVRTIRNVNSWKMCVCVCVCVCVCRTSFVCVSQLQ